jgi:hypothetical protein
MNPELHTDLGPIPTTPKTGREKFHADKTPVEGFTLQEFWVWSVSDLVSNATRGRLAEFIVAKALGISTAGVRDEWEAFDLKTPDGVKIQVKSSAYIQSWNQTKYSYIIFSTAKTRYWDAKTNKMEKKPKRHADVYIFAVLAYTGNKPEIDPLNVKQWEFYVLSKKSVGKHDKRSKVSITLNTLVKLKAGPVDFDGLAEKVRSALA